MRSFSMFGCFGFSLKLAVDDGWPATTCRNS
jgi:hypothetical protein